MTITQENGKIKIIATKAECSTGYARVLLCNLVEELLNSMDGESTETLVGYCTAILKAGIFDTRR